MQLRDMTEPEMKKMMQDAANGVVQAIPTGTLFALIVFDEPRVGQYISNANRSDMIKALRETADRLEMRQDVPMVAGK